MYVIIILRVRRSDQFRLSGWMNTHNTPWPVFRFELRVFLITLYLVSCKNSFKIHLPMNHPFMNETYP